MGLAVTVDGDKEEAGERVAMHEVEDEVYMDVDGAALLACSSLSPSSSASSFASSSAASSITSP